jgi:polar amino acid transport system substrate-binding protein
MKKIFLLFTLLLAVFTLASCESEPPLRVAMDLRYPPFETVSDLNDPEGISVDIAKAFGVFIGREVEIVNTGFGAIIPALESGEVDIAIASMSITEARKAIVDFTDPYFYFKIIALVNQAFATTNNITESSSTADLRAIANAKYVGIAGQITADRTAIPIGATQTFEAFTELSTVVESIANGDADIFLLSANPVIQAYNANKDKTMVVFSSFLSSPIGMAVQKGNTALLEQANDFIATFNEPGGLYDILRNKYDADILAILGRYGLDFYIDEN